MFFASIDSKKINLKNSIWNSFFNIFYQFNERIVILYIYIHISIIIFSLLKSTLINFVLKCKHYLFNLIIEKFANRNFNLFYIENTIYLQLFQFKETRKIRNH